MGADGPFPDRKQVADQQDQAADERDRDADTRAAAADRRGRRRIVSRPRSSAPNTPLMI